MSVSQPSPAALDTDATAVIADCLFPNAGNADVSLLDVSSSGNNRHDAGELAAHNTSFLSVGEREKDPGNVSAHRVKVSLAGGYFLPVDMLQFGDSATKQNRSVGSLSLPQNSARQAKQRARQMCDGQKFSMHMSGAYRDPSSLTVLDLASLNLERVKKSFFAHALTFSRNDLLDMYKVANNVGREMFYAERQMDRQQHHHHRQQTPTQSQQKKQKTNRAPHPRQRPNDGGRLSISVISDVEGDACGGSVGSNAEDSFVHSNPVTDSGIFAAEVPSQKTRLLSIWLYDRLVEQKLCDLRYASSKKVGDAIGLQSSFSSRALLSGGTKAVMVKLRGPPTPPHLQGFDIFDDLANELRDHESTSSLIPINMSVENTPLPLPVFVYVFSRAVFRMCYLDRFPKGMFSTGSGESSSSNTTTKATTTNAPNSPHTHPTRTTKNESVSPNLPLSRHQEIIIQDVSSLLEECRHVVLRFFELFDIDQKGVITWSTFTDLLMEQVEVQHRVMMVKENSEANVQSDARVFDEYVLEQFPSVMRRLGYTGAVVEVRHSKSIIIIEGLYDFAVCDSSCSTLIQRKLLVRSADALFAHRQGAPDEWSPERWEAATERAVEIKQNQKYNRRIMRYEDGRSRDDESAMNVLKIFKPSPSGGSGGGGKDAGGDANGSPGTNKDGNDDRMNKRTKPSLESSIQVQDVSPELPRTIITLHNDLLLRFFNMEQHIWVLPETIVISCKETMTSMEWCMPAPDGDQNLNKFLFLGTRSGEIYKLDLLAILQKIVFVKATRGDAMTTGVAATLTVRDNLEPYIIQRQHIHKEFVTSLSLIPSGILLSSSLDGTVILSRAVSMVTLRSFRVSHDAGVRFACITPIRNIIVTLSSSNKLSLWGNTNQSSHVDLYDPISPHYFPIISVKVDEGLEQLITVDSSGYAKVWNLRTNLMKMSFYAISRNVFSTFRHMYSSENAVEHNGYRLFDVDETELKKPRFDKNLQKGLPAFLQTTLSTIEAAAKACQFHPARFVAYDYLTKRLFVTGAKNSVVCVFTSGLTSLRAHSSPICHISLCEVNHWLFTASLADCRFWSYQTGTLTLGLRANNPEFIMVRMAPVFGAHTSLATSAQLVAVTGESDRYVLDTCKKPLPVLDDVMHLVRAQADAHRRERSGKSLPKQVVSTEEMRRVALLAKLGRNTSQGLISKTSGGNTEKIFSATGDNNSNIINGGDDGVKDGGCAVEDDLIKSQGASHRILCAHVEIQERLVFYALSNGDIRVHRTDSGRLSKTLVTMPPSTDLILTAVVQYRYLFTSTKRLTDRSYSTLSEDGDPVRGGSPSGAPMRVHDIAHILHRLLYHEKKITLQEEESFSIHKEAVGMMTTRDGQELSVMYADGLIRFFPLVGNSVHAHRIIIPEFLVTRAISYMRLERSLQKKLGGSMQEFSQKNKSEEISSDLSLNFIVEADAVSFVVVSKTLEFICLVQVNGRVSIMDMRTSSGTLVQVFNVSGEVSAVSFLGAYPCLIIADTQGIVNFFLIKGAHMLSLLEDFYKAVLLYRRHHHHRQNTSSSGSYDAQSDESYKQSSGSTLRMWWFHTPGVPTALHFDPAHATLYIGTRQGYFSSYLIRNLIMAFDLHPVLYSTRGAKTFDSHITHSRSHSDSNEQRVCNLLLVFFGITPEQVVLCLDTNRANRYQQGGGGGGGGGARVGMGNAGVSISWRVGDVSASASPPRHCPQSPVSYSAESIGSRVSSAIHTRMWKSSLSWIFDSCKPLFFPTSRSTSPGSTPPSLLSPYAVREMGPLPFDLHTVTLSDLLIGAAILRHALLLMVTISDSSRKTRRRKSNVATFGGTARHDPRCNDNDGGEHDSNNFAGISLSPSDIKHIRQCIVEELQYRNTSDNMHERVDMHLPYGGLPSLYEVEEEFDLDTVRENSYIIPGAICANWVEFLFRRHVINTANDSPLLLLSPNATLERARCERYERCKLLQLQHELEQETVKETMGSLPLLSPTSSPPPVSASSQLTAVTIDWDAFIEGTLTHLLSEIFRRRRLGGATGGNSTEEDSLNTNDDGGGVRCINTRRNGFLFIGSANGSVALWTPYGGARLQEFCPCMILEETIFRIGNNLKMRLAQEVDRVTRRRQREAHATALHNAKGHDTLLRNLNVKYKAAMMKNEATRAVMFKNSITGLGESFGNNASSSISSNSKTGSGLGAGFFVQATSSTTSRASLCPPQSNSDKLRSLLEKEKEVLLALVNTTPVEAAERGILLEDLYFLPMHSTMLSELEEFDLDAYGLAVDLAVERLKREVCGVHLRDDVEVDTMMESRHTTSSFPRSTKAGGGGEDHTVPLVCTTSGGKRGNTWLGSMGVADEEEKKGTDLILEELNAFFISAHEKLESTFYTEEMSYFQWKKSHYDRKSSPLISRRQRPYGGSSLSCKEWRRSIFHQYTADFSQSTNNSWELTHGRALPSYVQLGKGIGPGVITVAMSSRGVRHLSGCFGLELERMSETSHWCNVEEAIQSIVGRSCGLLTRESFSGLARSLAHKGSRSTRAVNVMETTLHGRQDKRRQSQKIKTTLIPIEPLIVLACTTYFDDSSTSAGTPHQSWDPRPGPDIAVALNNMNTTARAPEKNIGSKERFTVFLTETPGESNPVQKSLFIGGTQGAATSLTNSNRQATRPMRKMSSNSTISYAEDDETVSISSAVLSQWPLHRKDNSHRARLSRTGRVTASLSQRISTLQRQRQISSATNDGAASQGTSRDVPGFCESSADTFLSTVSFQNNKSNNKQKGLTEQQNTANQQARSVSLPLLHSNNGTWSPSPQQQRQQQEAQKDTLNLRKQPNGFSDTQKPRGGS